MALWQIVVDGKPLTENWDDELKALPGEEGFTTELVAGYCQTIDTDKPVTFNYLGTPNWERPPKARPKGEVQ
jgi:hypothetical protein